jgi:hypothetical protein
MLVAIPAGVATGNPGRNGIKKAPVEPEPFFTGANRY